MSDCTKNIVFLTIYVHSHHTVHTIVQAEQCIKYDLKCSSSSDCEALT